MSYLLKLLRKAKPKRPEPEPNFTPEPLDPANHPD